MPALSAMHQPTSPIDLPTAAVPVAPADQRATAAEANAPPQNSAAPTNQVQTQNQAILSQDPAYYWNYARRRRSARLTRTPPPNDLTDGRCQTRALTMPAGRNRVATVKTARDCAAVESALAEQDTETSATRPIPRRRARMSCN